MRRARFIALLLVAAALAGCASSSGSTRPGTLQVVAAENVWGSIAAQLGGTHTQVTSIVNNPSADPHSYEPTVADAKAVAGARLVIVNGIGYDRWASQLLAASPAPGRLTLNVGSRLRLAEGDNPHRWYSPADVETIAGEITTDYKRLDPAHAADYERRRVVFERTALAPYHAAMANIRRRYAGTPVGASESIFALLAPALGLRLPTPPGFMSAISEGSDVSAQDTIMTEAQVTGRRIRVWIENAQNITPEVRRLTSLAHDRGIPVTTITETLVPAHATFEQWQTEQLRALAAALHFATGR